MKWITIIFLGLLLLGGIWRIVVSLAKRSDFLGGADRMLDNRRVIALGLTNIIGSIVGFAVLFEQESAFNVLMGVSIVTLLCEVAFRKGSVDWSGNTKPH